MFMVNYKDKKHSRNKKSNIVTVFDVRINKNGYPQFLVYIDKQWKYISAKHYKPLKNL